MYRSMNKPEGSGRKKRDRTDYELQLDSLLREKKKMNGEPYSEQSIKTFINGIVKLGKIFLPKVQVMNDLKWLEDSDTIIKFIETAQTPQKYPYSLASKLAFYQTIIICLGATGVTDETILKPYWDQRDNINIARSAHYDEKKSFNTTNGANQTDVLNEVSPNDIMKLIDNMDTLSYNDENELIQRKLFMISTIIRLHTEFPWRNDLADVKVIYSKTYEQKIKDGTEKDFNWLVFEPKQYTFIINKFKTAKKYNKIIAPVENKHVKLGLKKWIIDGMGDDIDDKYLFSWDDGRPLSRNNISVLLSAETKKFLKKPISTTLLCKIFDESKANVSDMSAEDFIKLKKQSYLRGHDPRTRLSIYRNPNNK